MISHFSQEDKPRFSNLSQSKGKSLEKPKVQKRPYVSNPTNQIDEIKNQIQNEVISQQNILIGMEEEAINQEEAILQDITSNMMNSVTDLESELNGEIMI